MLSHSLEATCALFAANACRWSLLKDYSFAVMVEERKNRSVAANRCTR